MLPTQPPNLMTEAMRWFGPADSVTLAEIRQTGAAAVFSALHDIPYGEAWPAEAILRRKAEIEERKRAMERQMPKMKMKRV